MHLISTAHCIIMMVTGVSLYMQDIHEEITIISENLVSIQHIEVLIAGITMAIALGMMAEHLVMATLLALDMV